MYQLLGKRILDLLVSTTCLVVLAPLLLAVSILIKAEDGGPVLFRQRRVGRKGVEFTFLKFRSMSVDSPQLPSSQASSLSVTRIGRIIRRTNIDELPQLLNVFHGDMSLVGPRPPIPTQTDLIRLRERNGSDECRPGLTGLAQINAYDGMSPEEKADWDGRYASGVTLMTDLAILRKTFRYLTKPPPVY